MDAYDHVSTNTAIKGIVIETLRFYFDEMTLMSLRRHLSNLGLKAAIKTVRK